MKNTDKVYNPVVQNALDTYHSQVHSALDAAQKLESITITARLAKMFGTDEAEVAHAIHEDYLVGA